MQQRWFPGYNVAAVSTLALVMTAPGQTLLVSLLNVPLRQEFNIEPFLLNGSYTAATVLASLPLVWVGRLTDRYGPRKMLVLVSLAFGLACWFTSAISHVAMVFAAFFLLRFLGQGSLALVGHHALAMWFHRRLGTLSGIRSVVLFAAWAPLPALTVYLLGRWGWRATWMLFGVVVAALVSLMAWLFVRDRPEDLGLAMDGDTVEQVAHSGDDEPGWGLSLSQARGTRAYWLLVAAAVLPPMIGTAILFDIQSLLGAHNIDPAGAARAVSVWSGSMALLAIPVGRLIDRVSARWLILLGTIAMVGSCFIFGVVSSERMAMAAMATYALGQSLVGATLATASARFFGRRHHGAIRSSLSRVAVIATGLGPLVFGASQRLTGGYQAALALFAALCLPMAVASLWLKAPPRDYQTA